MRPSRASPTMHAPRRKSCQALLPDLANTPCSATFRGWGRYCSPHLQECARLSGQHKDAAARAERLRRAGELSDRQVRGLSHAAAVDRAVERIRAYEEALREEERARAAFIARFPAERGERDDLRETLLEERMAACTALIEQLEQRREELLTATRQRRDRYRDGTSDPSSPDQERQPLLARITTRRSQSSRPGWLVWTMWIVLCLVLFTAIAMTVAFALLGPGSDTVAAAAIPHLLLMYF